MKVFDCFTFFNELDLLEIRLNELDEVVDHFVIVESDRTFTNAPKSRVFEENRSRFDRFAGKIIHVCVDDMPGGANPWKREQFQRNAILRGLGGAAEDDYILISDVDEIPRKSVLQKLIRQGGDCYGLRLWFFSLRLNNLNVAGPEVHTARPMLVRKRLLTTPEVIRKQRYQVNARGEGSAIDDAGWHFTSIGDADAVRAKIRSFSHQEFNAPEIVDRLDVEQLLESGADLFNRPDYAWHLVNPGHWLPAGVVDDLERYQHLISPPAQLDQGELARAALINVAQSHRRVAGNSLSAHFRRSLAGRLRQALGR